MTRSGLHSVVHGAVGGLLAGAFVALWFLVVDLIARQPFHTPAMLAGVLLGGEVPAPTFRLVAVYTVLHFGVFVALGAGMSAFMHGVRIVPSMALAILFGLGILDTVHYGSLLLVRADLLTALPVPHVVAANLLAGLVLMAYLHYAVYREVPLGPAAMARFPLVAEGLGTGLIGAGAVAFWFFVLDTMTSYPFYTPAALGSAIFLGAQGPGEVRVTWAVIGAYTTLHVAAFWAVGIAFTWVVQRLERTPNIWRIVLYGFVVLEGLFVGAVGLASAWVLGALAWWAIAVGNVVAVGAMGRWLTRTHPQLLRQLMEAPAGSRA
jgi:hypothetical protein